MTLFLLLAFIGVIQIAGLCIIGFVHIRMMSKLANQMALIAMFKKSRTIQDLAAMQAMGITVEGEEPPEVEEKEEEVLSVDELSPGALEGIRNQL